MLAEAVEEQETRGSQAAPAGHCSARSGDVTCDFCTGRKRKATKFCLQCRAYSCEEHLQPHNEVIPLKKHRLLEASTNLQEIICSRHDEIKKVFCHTDQTCICYLCSVDEHRGHMTVSAKAEMAKRQNKARVTQQDVKQNIQNTEESIKVLKQEVDAINRSAETALKDSEKTSTELIQLIETKSAHVRRKIISQQEMEVRRVKELQEKMNKQLVELRRRETELETLSHTTNETLYLLNCPNLSKSTKLSFGELDKINDRPLLYFKDVTTAVSEARDKLMDICTKEWNKISKTVFEANVLLPQYLKKRDELARYKRSVTLDPNTANTQLLLSEGNTKATSVNNQESYPDHPDRFLNKVQVLGRQHLTGRCYWEVEWSGLGISIAVAYKDISRTGDESGFGNNNKSWVLEWSSNGNYTFKHDSEKVTVTGPQAFRIGVFLDHRAGILSFHSISETVTLLHRIKTTFTQPLLAGLCVHYKGAKAKIG